MKIITYLKEIWRGKDLYRIFMNQECTRHSMLGKVLDIGSGLKLASYHRFLQREPSTLIECLDLGFEGEGGRHIDLEKDSLPHATESIDTVLLFNVLEHLYNYFLVLSEIKRVLKAEGQFIGVVPFLVAYHPDPHDYWRYTKETLQKIFTIAGFTHIEIKPFGYGPGVAALSQMEQVIPRSLKIIVAPKALFFDWLLLKFRPKMNKDKFPLGLFFVVKK